MSRNPVVSHSVHVSIVVYSLQYDSQSLGKLCTNIEKVQAREKTMGKPLMCTRKHNTSEGGCDRMAVRRGFCLCLTLRNVMD